MAMLRFACGICVLMLTVTACDLDSELPQITTGETAWRLINPTPFDVQINAMWGVSSGQIIAVGDFGALMIKEGDKWRRAPSPTRTHIYDIHGYDWEHVWAVCAEGLLFFNGKRWTLARAEPRDSLDRIWCRAPNDVMLVTSERYSHHFDGQRWLTQRMPVHSSYYAGHWLVGWQQGYTAVGRHGEAATWSDGAWGLLENVGQDVDLISISIEVNRIPDIWDEFVIVTGQDSQANGIFPTFYHFDTDPWQSYISFYAEGELLDAVLSPTRGRLYFVMTTAGADTIVIRDSWHNSPLKVPGASRASLNVFRDPSDPYGEKDLLILAGSSGVFCEGNPEEGFTRCEGGISFSPRDLHVWPNGDFVATNGRQGLLHGRSGHLELQTDGIPADIVAIWGPDPESIFAVGGGGTIIHLTPDLPPMTMVSPVSFRLYEIWGFAANDIWALGYRAMIHYDGAAWTSVPDVPADFFYDVTGLASDAVFALTENTIWRWDGASWSLSLDLGGSPIRAMASLPDEGVLFALHEISNNSEALWRFREDQWEKLTETPRGAESLVALGANSVLISTPAGCFMWADNVWQAIPHPAANRWLTPAPSIQGTATGGVYSVSNTGSVHYLDLGGTQLWP